MRYFRPGKLSELWLLFWTFCGKALWSLSLCTRNEELSSQDFKKADQSHWVWLPSHLLADLSENGRLQKGL
jgi:hypothetical protein